MDIDKSEYINLVMVITNYNEKEALYYLEKFDYDINELLKFYKNSKKKKSVQQKIYHEFYNITNSNKSNNNLS